MKIALYTIMLLLMSITWVSAQTLNIQQNQVIHQELIIPSIQVTISPNTKEVKKAWKNYVQDNYGADVDGLGLFSNKDLLTAEKATILPKSDKQIDLYAKIVKDENMTRMNIYGSLGFDIYINPADHPVEFQAIESIVDDFLSGFLPNYFSEVVEESRDDVEDSTNSVTSIEDRLKKNTNKIADLLAENEDLRKDLQKSKQELVASKHQLSKVKAKLETIKDKITKQSNK